MPHPQRPEPLLSFVRRKLAETRGRWDEVKLGSGVPYNTLGKIARGTVPNPGVLTVQALADYFGYEGLPAPA